MTTRHPGSRITGSMRVENGEGTVRMEDVYDTAVEDLWSALTHGHRMVVDLVDDAVFAFGPSLPDTAYRAPSPATDLIRNREAPPCRRP